jgi:hypothetical protein
MRVLANVMLKQYQPREGLSRFKKCFADRSGHVSHYVRCSSGRVENVRSQTRRSLHDASGRQSKVDDRVSSTEEGFTWIQAVYR